MAVKRAIAHSFTRRMKTPLLRPFQSSVTRRFTPAAVLLSCRGDQSDGGGRNEEMGRHWSRIMVSRSAHMIHSSRSRVGFIISRRSRSRMNAGLFQRESMIGSHMTRISVPWIRLCRRCV